MRRLVARRLGGSLPDAGAYAILYAVLAMVLIGLGGIVVDFANVRQDRRLDRSATDAAVIAGAEYLNPASPSAGSIQAACLRAWVYLSKSLRITTPAGACSAFASYSTASAVAAYCAGASPAEIADVRTVGTRTFRIAWPIPYHAGGTISEFLSPDLAPAPPGAVTQNFDTAVDGTDAGCDRLGVAVIETQRFGLGGAINASGTQTQVHSVARFNPSGGDDLVPVPLVVLDPTTCNALDVGGGGTTGGLVVRASFDGVFPGGIAVDSDASGGEDNCNGGKTPISVSNNSYIWALDTPSGVSGVIRAYSHAIGLPDNRVWSGNTAGCPSTGPWLSVAPAAGPPNLCPLPNRVSFPRATSEPWVNRYNCNIAVSTCPQPTLTSNLPSPRNYVDQWVAYATGSIPPTFATVRSGGSCTLTTGTYTNVYSSCNTLTITGTVQITGRLVALHDLSIGNSDCLLVNDSNTAHCTSKPADVPVSSRGADNGGMYIGGALTVSNSASLVTNQSFIYLVGRFDINTSGVFALTAPYGTALTPAGVCTPAANSTQAPTPTCFEAMALWSPYAGPATGGTRNQLQGQTQLLVDGTVFTPNAAFFYAGGVANDQARAQFVTRRLTIQGSGRLTMTPDSSRGTNLKGSSIGLIR